MKTRTSRRILYLVIVIGLIISFNYRRIAISFMRIPKEISDLTRGPTRVVIIRGNPCTICSSGEFLLSLSDQQKTFKNVFVLPTEYDSIDIENLKEAFGLEGIFIRSDETFAKFMKKAATYSLDTAHSTGYFIEIRANRTVKQVSLF